MRPLRARQPNTAAEMFMIRIRHATIARLRDRLQEHGSRPSLVVTSADATLARIGLLPPEEAAAVQTIDPIFEFMFLMMAADGELTAEETDVIKGAVRELTAGYVRSATFEYMLERYHQLLKQQGSQARLESIASNLADDPAGADTAFVLAAAVAFADEKIEDSENDLLNGFAEAVGIDETHASQLLDELEGDWQDDS
jgi:uncharacterized tellurite resistance protein B-like protein